MKRYKYVIAFLVVVIIGLNIRLPYDLVKPGSVRALAAGSDLHMVTVLMGRATLFHILSSWGDPYSILIPATDQTIVDEEKEKKEMIDSQSSAEKVAFEIIGDPRQNVHFNLDKILGPSAGLMMTLEIIDEYTEGKLTKGDKVAGTGTIDPDGKVGKIGAIEWKLVAADRANMDVFFVPSENLDQANKFLKTYQTDMKIIPVKDVQEALQYLEGVDSDGRKV